MRVGPGGCGWGRFPSVLRDWGVHVASGQWLPLDSPPLEGDRAAPAPQTLGFWKPSKETLLSAP